MELHLRIDRTPSLPPQTNKHTTHPTWYVLPFILSGVLRSSLDAERGVKAVVEIRFAALEDRVSYRIRIRPKSCLRFTRLFGAVWGICWSSFLAHLRRFCFYFVCLFFGWWWWGGGSLHDVLVWSGSVFAITAQSIHRYRADRLFQVKRSVLGCMAADRMKIWTRFGGVGITHMLFWVRTVELRPPHRLKWRFYSSLSAAQACSEADMFPSRDG